MSAVIGIDPGTKGGLAVLSADGRVLMVQAFEPEMTAVALANYLSSALFIADRYGLKGVFLEKVGHKRGDGARGSFTFGGVYRLLEGILLGKGIKPRYVLPAFWQARLECLSGGNKAVTLGRAKFLFGSQVKVTHGIADALLICEYGRRCLAAPSEPKDVA